MSTDIQAPDIHQLLGSIATELSEQFGVTVYALTVYHRGAKVPAVGSRQMTPQALTAAVTTKLAKSQPENDLPSRVIAGLECRSSPRESLLVFTETSL